MQKQTPKHRTLALQRRRYSQFQRSLKIEAATIYDTSASYPVKTQLICQGKYLSAFRRCIKKSKCPSRRGDRCGVSADWPDVVDNHDSSLPNPRKLYAS